MIAGIVQDNLVVIGELLGDGPETEAVVGTAVGKQQRWFIGICAVNVQLDAVGDNVSFTEFHYSLHFFLG